MIVTIQNLTSFTLNDLDSYTSGSGPSAIVATGGARKYPLPYPFGHIGPLAASATKALPMKPRDLGKRIQAETFSPADGWNILVQKGWVSFSIAAESTNRDIEEKFFDLV